VSSAPTRMPDYNPAGRRRFKPLRDRADTTPRVGVIVGVSPNELLDAVGRVLCSGCAILFSPTSDGGAVSITVYHGDDRSRDYASSAEEFATSLTLASDLAEAHAYEGPKIAPKAPVRGSESVTK
jgi:hypothetical protein